MIEKINPNNSNYKSNINKISATPPQIPGDKKHSKPTKKTQATQ